MNHFNLKTLNKFHNQWMDIPTAAEYAGVGKSTMYRLVKEGLISFYEHPHLKTAKKTPKIFIHKITLDSYWGKNFIPSICDMNEEPPHAQLRIK